MCIRDSPSASQRQHEQADRDDEIPEVDARLIPPTVRHGAILGALGDVAPGAAMIVAAPHDPFPILAQIDEREGENVRYSYVQRGPDVWRVLLERVA